MTFGASLLLPLLQSQVEGSIDVYYATYMDRTTECFGGSGKVDRKDGYYAITIG